MYTPVQLPVRDGESVSASLSYPWLTLQWETTVVLREEGSDSTDDERRRFKIVFTQANVIDLNTIVEFCKGDQQAEKTKEIMVSASLPHTTNIVARRSSSYEYPPSTRPHQSLQSCRCPRPTVLWHEWRHSHGW